ncbi:hypothetical protein WA026_014900 [Henosepilachna vigintioctopunctata]|uniref:Beta-1,4-N-acetylgalactosaminyltransferase n=1 Tax=Henosepilachna vigintioctopunctata TaxID=420089 RepID=A0AAW1V024_9CUCU
MKQNNKMKFKQRMKHPCLPLYFRKEKLLTTFSIYLAALLTIMFIITLTLSIKLLNADSCQNEGNIIKYFSRATNMKNSSSNHRLALLVPYRDRFEELLEFVPYIHNFLNKQHISHGIYVLNQVDGYRFNRASLINVGYLQVKEEYDYIAMHDVDLLPLNANLSYAYPQQPYHLAAPNLHPRYHYAKFIGGILLINREQFGLVNGLSNNYWGWGLEDDEFYVRLKDANLNITRPENVTTGINNTFRHIHKRERKRDTLKCYNQREITRKRDRKTGLHNIEYELLTWKNMTIDFAPLTVMNIKLHCDLNLTPWCNCSSKSSTPTSNIGKQSKS